MTAALVAAKVTVAAEAPERVFRSPDPDHLEERMRDAHETKNPEILTAIMILGEAGARSEANRPVCWCVA